MKVAFRPMTKDDLPVMHEWLQREHVRRWWNKRETLEDVVQHYVPAIEGKKPTDLYFILVDERPVGFIQTYRVADYPEYRRLVDAKDDVAGVDLFLAEQELTGRGLGSAVLAKFVGEVVFSDPAISACIADPDAENQPSLRAFEKAGFHPVRQFVDPEDERLHTLMRTER